MLLKGYQAAHVPQDALHEDLQKDLQISPRSTDEVCGFELYPRNGVSPSEYDYPPVITRTGGWREEVVKAALNALKQQSNGLKEVLSGKGAREGKEVPSTERAPLEAYAKHAAKFGKAPEGVVAGELEALVQTWLEAEMITPLQHEILIGIIRSIEQTLYSIGLMTAK